VLTETLLRSGEPAKPIVVGAPWVWIRNLPHAAGASYGSTVAARAMAGEARQAWAQKLS
jgi:hypothetical protein